VSGIPPFERFYETHKGEVLAFLRRRAGRDRADDLFQETFLRALRAYGRLEHGEHLRAWVFTIASNAVVDAARRERPTAELAAFCTMKSPGCSFKKSWSMSIAVAAETTARVHRWVFIFPPEEFGPPDDMGPVSAGGVARALRARCGLA
jgi:RNA polymerase sigma factor (sigma-70 family)